MFCYIHKSRITSGRLRSKPTVTNHLLVFLRVKSQTAIRTPNAQTSIMTQRPVLNGLSESKAPPVRASGSRLRVKPISASRIEANRRRSDQTPRALTREVGSAEEATLGGVKGFNSDIVGPEMQGDKSVEQPI